jgi:antitoxin Phd
MATWQLQDAKAKLSEVIDTAKKQGPQIITQRGVKSAVIIPFDQWERESASRKPTLLEVLQSGPQFDLQIPPRRKMRHRKPVKF